MEALAEFLQQNGISPQETAQIIPHFTARTLEKQGLFVKEGRVSSQLAFLESGMLQYFSITDKGEERTTYIALPGSFVASLLTYLSGVPARENIRAISEARLWVIEKSEVEKLRLEVPAFGQFYVGLLEWQICCIDKGKFDLITLTAEERYEKLLREEPELLQQVPLQYIASMMGMTPRHLSRLRGKN